ncbi:hypothetical protein OG21DRAFT_808956 [Imleria badia]|nr:hypothetical protein OG21DRAFT_808956 [Imleria badia]
MGDTRSNEVLSRLYDLYVQCKLFTVCKTVPNRLVRRKEHEGSGPITSSSCSSISVSSSPCVSVYPSWLEWVFPAPTIGWCQQWSWWGWEQADKRGGVWFCTFVVCSSGINGCGLRRQIVLFFVLLFLIVILSSIPIFILIMSSFIAFLLLILEGARRRTPSTRRSGIDTRSQNEGREGVEVDVIGLGD